MMVVMHYFSTTANLKEHRHADSTAALHAGNPTRECGCTHPCAHQPEGDDIQEPGQTLS